MKVETSAEVTTPTPDDRPRIWDPVNDSTVPNPLVGTVLSFDSIETDYGTRLIVLVHEESAGTVWSRLVAGTVLEGQFAHRKPAPGEVIRLEYVGEKVSTTGKFEGKAYHSWDLRVRRPPQVPNWEALADGEVKLLDAASEQPAERIESDVPIAAVEEVSSTEADDDVPF